MSSAPSGHRGVLVAQFEQGGTIRGRGGRAARVAWPRCPPPHITPSPPPQHRGWLRRRRRTHRTRRGIHGAGLPRTYEPMALPQYGQPPRRRRRRRRSRHHPADAGARTSRAAPGAPSAGSGPTLAAADNGYLVAAATTSAGRPDNSGGYCRPPGSPGRRLSPPLGAVPRPATGDGDGDDDDDYDKSLSSSRDAHVGRREPTFVPRRGLPHPVGCAAESAPAAAAVARAFATAAANMASTFNDANTPDLRRRSPLSYLPPQLAAATAPRRRPPPR
jgi:hypothetical protein